MISRIYPAICAKAARMSSEAYELEWEWGGQFSGVPCVNRGGPQVWRLTQRQR